MTRNRRGTSSAGPGRNVGGPHGVRGAVWVALVLFLGACPGSGAVPATPAAAPASSTSSGAGDAPANPCSAPAAKPEKNGATGARLGAAAGLPCPTATCMYHGGADAYFLCLSGTSGACFHYGRSCAPSHMCMYDAATASYRTCTRASEGRCAAFAAPCAPPARCLYNPADGLHHVCEQTDRDKCARFGAVCDPR